jgi:hypothetical protein
LTSASVFGMVDGLRGCWLMLVNINWYWVVRCVPRCQIVPARAALTIDERHTLTDHVIPHHQDDGLFRTAKQADEQQLTSDVTDVRPVTRPSRNPFPHAVNHGAAEHQRPAIQRNEAAMRSLRFPFDDDDCR